jgi:hypothetical protein
MNPLPSVFLRAALLFSWFLTDAPPATAQQTHKSRKVDFNRPAGPYSEKDFRRDFGNFSTDDAFTDIVDGALRVSFPEGRKIDGLQGARVRIQPARICELEFRVRYPKDFQTGLHGKQFGLGGGAAYTGGLGAEAAKKGDGWSVRLQFDAHGNDITNQLYVYHADMKGKYGEDLGTRNQQLRLKRGKWHRITLRVTMQSAPDKADGRVEVLLDGKRGIDLKGIHFVAGDKGRVIDTLLLESFCGGYGATPGKNQHVMFDDIRWDCKTSSDK